MTQSLPGPGLAALLGEFSLRINQHSRLRTTLAGWQPVFYIQARDTGGTFQVHFSDSCVQRIVATDVEPADDSLLMRGDESTLCSIFSGSLSPLQAYTDGELEVYGKQKDQIKLDTMALIVWGA